MQQVNISNLDLLKAPEVAEILRIHRITVYEWAKKGILTPIFINGNFRFKREDIEKMITEAKGTDVPSTSSVA